MKCHRLLSATRKLAMFSLPLSRKINKTHYYYFFAFDMSGKRIIVLPLLHHSTPGFPIPTERNGRRINLPPPAHCGQNTAAQQPRSYLCSAAKSADHQDRVSQASGGYVQLGQSWHAEALLTLPGCSIAAPMHKHWSCSLLPSPPFFKDAHGDPSQAASDRHLGRLLSDNLRR